MVAEEVGEILGNKDGEEDNHGDRVPEEVKDEDEERDEHVIHAEMIEVVLDVGGGVNEENGWTSSRHGRRVMKTERAVAMLVVVVDVEGSVL